MTGLVNGVLLSLPLWGIIFGVVRLVLELLK